MALPLSGESRTPLLGGGSGVRRGLPGPLSFLRGSFGGKDTLTHLGHKNTAAGLWNRGLAGGGARGNVVKERKLESEPKTNGRLGAVGGAIRVAQPRNVVRRRIVDQPSILRPQEQAVGDVAIGAPAVDECGACLIVGARYVFRIKYDRSRTSKTEYRPPLERHAIDERARRFMRVTLDAGCARLRAIVLSVESVTVVDFRAKPLSEVEPLSRQNAAAIGRALLDTGLRRVFDKATHALDCDFRTVKFLRIRWQPRDYRSGEPR